MTRTNQTLAFVTFAIILASTGCGDPGSFEETAVEDSSSVADDAVWQDDTTPTLEDELQLACEAYCETATFCRRGLFPGDCAEHCAASFPPEADDACLAAQVDLLNCYSPASCEASTEDLRIECGHALLEVRSACTARMLRRDGEDDGEIRVVRVREGDELLEVETDPETEPSEESGDEEPAGEEPAESEDSGPVFELPEIPEYQELPDLGPIVGFP